MTDDQQKEIIATIAKRHGVSVGADDPILILDTLLELLFVDAKKRQDVILRHFREEIEGAAHSWAGNASRTADAALNQALGATKGMMMESMEAGARQTAAAVKNEMAICKETVRRAHQVALLNLGAAAMTMIAAVVVLWAIVWKH